MLKLIKDYLQKKHNEREYYHYLRVEHPAEYKFRCEKGLCCPAELMGMR